MSVHPIIKLKYHKKLKVLSQLQLSRLIEVSQGFIAGIEAREKLISIPMLFKISSVLEICPRLLLQCTIDCDKCCYKTCKEERL